MSKFMQLIKALTPHLKSQKELDDAYLAQAADIHDLEARMQAMQAMQVHDRLAFRARLFA